MSQLAWVERYLGQIVGEASFHVLTDIVGIQSVIAVVYGAINGYRISSVCPA